ncbi:uncharacterized protein LOC108828084 [Raphanus sativus]|uniref:Uncharacterized protein LOC108828084 n=1 Tax=Raphanus sativus TaxID=3726 RepID=A0A9W3DEZ6_RAPSA|nr:uncharacterized protein LOC108828084 [Raphanus sativus]
MSEELPKRLFKEGEEPQVSQINNNCRIDYIIKKFTAWMPKELDVVKKDPVFAQIFKLHENGLGYSARVVHSFLCRELVTYSFTSFGLSLRGDHFDSHFKSTTQVLRRKDETVTLFDLWNKDKDSVKKWKNADRIRLIYLAFILCVVLARDEKQNIPLKYIKVVMDLEKIWAMEAVPKIGKLCGKKLDKAFADGPRCINWMGAGKVSYQEINRLEEIFTAEDDMYPFISWTGNMDIIQSVDFRRDDVEDERIKGLMELISAKNDFTQHVWDFEEAVEESLDQPDEANVNGEEGVNDEAAETDESDETFQTPRGSTSLGDTSKQGKKRLPDRGMEKGSIRFSMLFEQSISAMEQRMEKKMDEKLEQLEHRLKAPTKEPRVEVEDGETPSPSKTTTTQQPSLRRSTRGSPVDLNFTQEEASFRGISTQGVEGLSQASHVTDFDPSQTAKADDWWTPMTSVRGSSKAKARKDNTVQPSQWKKWSRLELTDEDLPQDGSPQSSLYYFSEESWQGFHEWSMKPVPLQIGPLCFNMTVAQRIVCAGKWLGNEEMDGFMFIWRVKTTLKRWAPTRVAFMTALFCLQLEAAYNVFHPDKKSYKLPEFLLSYGRGEIPSHGRTNEVWGVDVDRLYGPLFVNGNHWIAVCVDIIERKVFAFDCGGKRNRQYVEKFAAMIPRIVKAVAPPGSRKLHLSPYTIVDVPVQKRLNKSCCDCGAYALKYLECHLLGLDINLVNDEIIQGCRQKIGVELWEATHDPVYAEVMKTYVPSPWERSEVFDLEED